MANKISFIIDLKDRFSRSANKIKSSVVGATSKLDRFKQKIRQTEAALKRLSIKAKKAAKSIAGVGKNVALKVSLPAAALVALNIRNFDIQEKAIEKVKGVIESTGGTAKLSLEALRKEASRLQSETLFGDENILDNATAILLSFTKIVGKNFLKTQEIVLDLSAFMKTDLQSAAIQLGKALNDPVANLSALSRSGIQFDKVQKELINSLIKSNKLFEAQEIILGELNTQFGGQAKKLAAVGAGKLIQLSNILGDLSEEIGKIQFDTLDPLIDFISELANSFEKLSPEMKKFIAISNLLASILSPFILLIAGIAIAFSLISAPILIGIAIFSALVVIGAVLIASWDKIKSAAISLENAIGDSLLSMINSFVEFGDIVKNIFDSMINSFIEFGLSILSNVLDKITRTISFFSNLKKSISSLRFGDDEIQNASENIRATLALDPIKLKSQQDSSLRSKTDIAISLRAPERIVESTKIKSTGNLNNLNVGLNMIPEGA